ncbi:MAG TPA: hypothetical protein VN036_13085 [Devosia sp.]|nr:hypothetical protein [Devosia sp.]
MRKILILLAAFAGGSLSAAADELFVPEVTFPASHAVLAGRVIDILDLVPGMDGAEVKAALAGLHPADSIVEQQTSFRVASRGVTVQTADFLKSITAGKENDRIEVSFTGPASGVQAFSIERTLRYSDVLSAPTLESIFEALDTKYGVPSMRSSDLYQPNPNNAAKLVWAYSGGEQVPCRYLQAGQGPGCPLLLGGYDPSSLQHTATSRLDFDYIVTADIWPHDADIGKVRLFQVEVFDLARRKQAAQADTQAMLAEIERIHQQASKPAAAPAL